MIAAGVFWRLRLGHPFAVSAVPQPAGQGAGGSGLPDRPGAAASQAPVLAASPGFLAAAVTAVSAGRMFDAWDLAHRAQVCVAGAAAARAMGIGEPPAAADDLRR